MPRSRAWRRQVEPTVHLPGRWSALPRETVSRTEKTLWQTQLVLSRYGILTKAAVHADSIAGGFDALYRVARELEDTGSLVRGQLVENLGGAQFATQEAVDQLRGHQADTVRALVLTVTDPAQPYGAILDWPQATGTVKPTRRIGATVVLVSGIPVLYLDKSGHSIVTFRGSDARATTVATKALTKAVEDRRFEILAIRTVDGQEARTHPLAADLLSAGFRVTPQGLRLRAPLLP
jgi:ATP-dependent Lhr-like helicase